MKFQKFEVYMGLGPEGGPWPVGEIAGVVVFRGGTRNYECRVDADGYEVVHPDGGDMGRAIKGKPTLKRLGARWLVVLEGSSGEELAHQAAALPLGGDTYGRALGLPAYHPIYSTLSGGLTSRYVSYLIYETKPEESA